VRVAKAAGGPVVARVMCRKCRDRAKTLATVQHTPAGLLLTVRPRRGDNLTVYTGLLCPGEGSLLLDREPPAPMARMTWDGVVYCRRGHGRRDVVDQAELLRRIRACDKKVAYVV